jgi:hypothetical protein
MILKQDPILMFKQYGYVEVSKSNDGHSIGNCPLCGKENHFFINTLSDNKTWDCKVCARGGGFKRFMEFIVQIGKSNFKGNISKKLSENRGLSELTLNLAEIGYLPVCDKYIMPVYSHDKKTILNIKIFDIEEHTFKNTATCNSQMYGLWLIPPTGAYETIFVCEGEWDALAMIEILIENDQRCAVIGVPGAGTFKQEALPYFISKSAYLIYDNDAAGNNGCEKATRILFPIASKVSAVQWESSLPEGFDLRDLYCKMKRDASKTISYVFDNCHVKNIESSGTVPADISNGVPVGKIDCQEVYRVFRKWLHMPDCRVLDIIFGTVLVNRLPGDPLWMFIVAPPGFTKTEPLLTLTGARQIETISTLTPAALISGMNFGGVDPSLIPQLNGKVLIIKDYTTILNLPHEKREEIHSILRDAYDGEASKPLGNGVFRKYKSKFGIIAAVTPVIEQFTEEHAALGERFLRWRQMTPILLDERREYIKRALGNCTKEQEMRSELSAVGKRVLLADYTEAPECPMYIQDKIIGLAQWIAIMRGTVYRDKYSKDITHKSFVELGTRVSKQLLKLGMGVAMFRGLQVVDEGCYEIVVEVAKSSVALRYIDAVHFMQQNRHLELTSKEMQAAIGLPPATTDMVMHNMLMLGAVNKIKKEGDLKIYWTVKSEILDLIDNCEIFKKKEKKNAVKINVKKAKRVIYPKNR